MLKVMWFFALAASCLAGGKPFESISTAEAFQRAANENKYVFANFYIPSCAECKKMEKKTFQNKKVLAWLKEHAVAVALDADQQTELAVAQKVIIHPTLIFFKPDGSVVWREVGYCDAEKFQQIVTWISEGKTPLQIAQAAANAKPLSALNQVLLAERYLDIDDTAQAVEVIAKLLAGKEGNKYSDLSRRTIYDTLVMCGYEAASTVLNMEFERFHGLLLAGKMDQNSLFELAKLAPLARKPLLPLFDEVKQAGLPIAQLKPLDPLLTNELLAADRYQDAVQLSSVEERAAVLKEMIWATTVGLSGPEQEFVLKSAWDKEETLFHLMLGLNRVAEAKQLSEAILSRSSHWANYNRLSRIAFKFRLLDEQMVAWAKQAYELSGGKNAEVILTWASVLIVTNRWDEARHLLEQGLEIAPQGSGIRESLLELLEKLKSHTN